MGFLRGTGASQHHARRREGWQGYLNLLQLLEGERHVDDQREKADAPPTTCAPILLVFYVWTRVVASLCMLRRGQGFAD